MDVKRAELVQFSRHYSKSTGARSADRLRSYLKQLFNYRVEPFYLPGQNPMVCVTRRVTGYKPIDRERVLTHDEIHMVRNWKIADQGWQKTEDNVRVINFLLLTGLRISLDYVFLRHRKAISMLINYAEVYVALKVRIYLSNIKRDLAEAENYKRFKLPKRLVQALFRT